VWSAAELILATPQPATAASVLAGAALTALDPDALAAAQAGGRALTAEEALAEVIASA
jgi:hypothetical protein